MRLNTCLAIASICILFTACGVSCAYSSKTKPKPEKIIVCEVAQILDIGMQSGKEYVVREKIDLRGKQVNVPEGVTITFERGGAILNGILNGNGTKVNSKIKNVLGVKMKGTWCVNRINDDLFYHDYLTDADIIANINTIQSDIVQNEITISRDYTVRIANSGDSGLDLKSNTKLHLKGTLTLAPNDFKSYSIISIKNKENIQIKGGNIVGDVGHHTYISGSSSEWGMGITIQESQNVSLEDLYITLCTGDGIYVSGGKEPSVGIYDHASKNVTIRKVTCDANRRQGISIIHVDGLVVRDCSFINTGQLEFTEPGAGIDIEPNVSNGQNMSVRNLVVENCYVHCNKGSAISCSSTYEADGRQNFENLLFSDCQTDGTLRAQSTDLVFRNCSFREVRFAAIHSPTRIRMEGCTIEGGYGIIVYAPTDKGVNYKDRLLALDLVNCIISVAEGETRTKSLISCYKNYVPNIEYINIEKCHLIVPESKDSAFKLIDYDMKDKMHISSSVIKMDGRDLDSKGIIYRGNTIHCRSTAISAVDNNIVKTSEGSRY